MEACVGSCLLANLSGPGNGLEFEACVGNCLLANPSGPGNGFEFEARVGSCLLANLSGPRNGPRLEACACNCLLANFPASGPAPVTNVLMGYLAEEGRGGGPAGEASLRNLATSQHARPAPNHQTSTVTWLHASA